MKNNRSEQIEIANALQAYLGDDYAVNFDDCESSLTRIIYKPLNKLVKEVPNGSMKRGLVFSDYHASREDRMQVYNMRACGLI